jgi:cystathionine gamma-synthase
MKKQAINSTICVHAGEHMDCQGAIHTPLYNHSTFGFPSTEAVLDVVKGIKIGNLYTRFGMNPTILALEKKLAALEKAELAYSFSSGMAAETALFMAYCRPGDHIICLGDIYGGTYELLNYNLREMKIETTFLLGSEIDQLESSVNTNTKLLFIETPTNPAIEIFDIEALAEFCKKRNILFVVDNTFASPVNQNPLTMGADLVVHSATKYMGGHSDVTAGVVMGSKEKLQPLWVWRKNLGQVIAPEVAFLLARSIKTLIVRVKTQNQTAFEIAQYLQNHPKIKKVNYPGLPDFAGHEIAKKQMSGFGGMLSFEFNGDGDSTSRMVDKLKVFTIAPSLGGVESLVTQPVTITHYGISPEERLRRGISDNMVRLSIGLEETQDLIDDLQQALE